MICLYSYINQSHKKKLLATQRSVLIRVTKAYATTSTAALPVLAGVLPIDLLLEKLTAHSCIPRGKNFLIGKIEFRYEDYDDGEMDTVKALRARVADTIMNAWNESWESSPKGRTTCEYFPDVRSRSGMNCIQLNHQLTQLLSGQGNFRAYLRRFSILEDDTCNCDLQESETILHLVNDCPYHTEERRPLSVAAARSRCRVAPSPSLLGPTYNLPPLSHVCQKCSKQQGTSRSGTLETSHVLSFFRKKL